MSSFLSEEYMAEASAALTTHDGFVASIDGVELDMQYIVTDYPAEGELSYHLAIADGAATLARGVLEAPDVTVTSDYATAVGISNGELNTQMAFMTGKLKVTGNMAKLMMNQAIIGEFAVAMSELEVEY